MTLDYHDALAKGKVVGAHPGGFYLTKKVLQNSNLTKEMHVLEVGCGLGQTAIYIAETIGCHVVAIDKHPEMIQHLRQQTEEREITIEILEENIERLPFVDEQFDFIFAESVLSFTNLDKSLNELRRVLKRGGTFIFNEMCLLEHMEQEELERFHNLYNIKGILTKEEWLNRLKATGLQNISIAVERKMGEEIADYSDADKILDNGGSVVYSEEVEEILIEQSILLMEYADRIGYIVIQGTV